MRSSLDDMRFGARLLLRAPTFTVVAVSSLALGMGATIAIVGAMNGLLLQPIQAVAPERLVAVFTSDFSGPAYGSSSYADAIDFAHGAPALAGLATARSEPLSLRAGNEAERVFAERVSANYFDVLGLHPVVGRLPSGALDSTTPDPAVVLSHRYWQRRFAGDPGVIGRAVRLGNEPSTIVGVAPAGYGGLIRGLDLDAFIIEPVAVSTPSRGDRGNALVGRLAPGASLEQAQAQLQAVATRLHREHRDAWSNRRGEPRSVSVLSERALRLPPQAVGPVTGFLSMLALTVGLVLLVACANVAGLLVARGADRRQEIAVRLSLGASRGRLVRQLLVESLLLATLASAAGLVVAQWLLVLLTQVRLPLPYPIRFEFEVDGTVVAATLVLGLITAVAFGLAPALQATRGLQHAANLRAGALPDRCRRVPLRAVLVVGQVALSMVLLVLTGLFLRSLQHAAQIDLGFETRHVLVATVDPSMLAYSPERGGQIYEAIVERVRAIPGVQDASVAQVVPLALDPDGGRRWMRPSVYSPQPGEDMEVAFNAVSAGYFRTLGITVVRGREFVAADRAGAEPVVIVNEAFAARYWPGRDALGEHVETSGEGGPTLRVVGVVANTKHSSRGESATPLMVLPFTQFYRPQAKVHVRSAGDPAALAPAVRAAIHAIDPTLPILALSTLADRTSVSLLPQQVAVSLIGVFGVVALLLSLLGLYGVLARAVLQRSREISIRLALGAAPRSVMQLVVGHGWRLTAIGLVVGLVLSAVGATLVGSLLPGISPLDPAAYGTAALLLGTAATLAMWLPARHALAVDPAGVLRSE